MVALSTTAPGASAAAGRKAAAAVGHAMPTGSAKATLAYWTPARMRSAKDVSTLIAGGPASTAPAVSKPPGKPGRVAGGLPAGASASGGIRANPAPIPQAFSYPYPYDSFNVPNGDYQKFPWRVNGKIFFSNDGGNLCCSGTSVAGVNGNQDENEVWTAGHCVSNTDGTHKWDSSAIFVPAYNGSLSDTNPYGEFVVYNMETTTSWLNNGDFSEDEGAMLVGYSTKKPAEHRILGNLVGWAGFAWNYSTNQQFVTFGYPAASPYNGKSMVEDIAAERGPRHRDRRRRISPDRHWQPAHGWFERGRLGLRLE